MMCKKMLLYLLCGVFLLSTALLAKPGAVFACSCAEQPSVEKLMKEELNRKTVIFAGKVIKVTPPRKKLTMSTADLVQVDFEVSTVWKGELKQKAAIYTAMSSASCGYEGFNVGTAYIVSAYEDSGKLATGICEYTKPLPSAGDEVKALGEGYAPLPLSTGEVLPDNGDSANEVSKEGGASELQLIIGALALFLIIGIVVVRVRRRHEK